MDVLVFFVTIKLNYIFDVNYYSYLVIFEKNNNDFDQNNYMHDWDKMIKNLFMSFRFKLGFLQN